MMTRSKDEITLVPTVRIGYNHIHITIPILDNIPIK